MRRPGDDRRVARLQEEIDFGPGGPMATALFSGAIDAPDIPWPSGDAIDSPLPLAGALDWARSRADRVSVQLDGAIFSAGRIPLDAPRLDESRSYARRRLKGWEFLDRTEDDPPISWDVVVEVDTLRASEIAAGGHLTPLGTSWKQAIRSSEGCRLVEITTTGCDGRIWERPGRIRGRDVVFWTRQACVPAVILRLDARTPGAVSQAALGILETAADAAGWRPCPEFSVGGAYPTGSKVAHWNAKL